MREDSKIEFKEQINKSFLKTVSAFSNYDGGKVYFGIDDNGEFVGIESPYEKALDIENMINDSITPNPHYKIDINSDNNVIELSVFSGMHKPYYYNSKAYIRHDSSTIEMDRLDLNNLILEGNNQSFDSVKSLNQTLTFNYLEGKLAEAYVVDKINEDVLRTLELYNAKYSGYTNAGELLSDKNQMPGIDIARFGENINIILERIDCSNKSILEQLDVAVDTYQKNYQFEKIEGFHRNKYELIPYIAFREAVANALVHRRWDMKSNIQISMFKNRIEIVSPGGLPSGLTEEEYLKGNISNIRNPILANVFYRLDIIEKFGTGIKRIKDEYVDFNIKPEFIITENYIIVTLPVTNEDDLTPDEKLILDLIDKGYGTTRELALKTNFGKSKSLSILNGLLDRGLINRIGQGRSTRYTKVND